MGNIAGSSKVICTDERNVNQAGSSHYSNNGQRALGSKQVHLPQTGEIEGFMNAFGFSDDMV